MKKPVAVFEITNMSIRLVVGIVVDDKPLIVYQEERSIEGMVVRGDIVDYQGIMSTIKDMCHVEDESIKLRFDIKEATVIFPAIGFLVLSGDKTTNVVSNDNIISEIDISNVLSLVLKENIPEGAEIVDIIPDTFVLEQQRTFAFPPIGQSSTSLKMISKVQCLPQRIVRDYKVIFKQLGITVRRSIISSHAITNAIKLNSTFPQSYILVDMGAGVTKLSLVGNHSIFGASSFLLGGNDLAMTISEELCVPQEEAIRLMEVYGLNDSELKFEPTISESLSPDGTPIKYTPSDLNVIVKDFVNNFYFRQLDTSISLLLKGYGEDVKRLPIVFTGGFSKLNGFKKLAKEKYSNNSIFFFNPSAIGCRDPKFSACVGALMCSAGFKGTLSDAQVTRVERLDK